MKHFVEFLKYQPPGRLITTGFAVVILLGAFLLLLPCSVKDGAEVSVIDALFTSTSAVCVTGLIAIDTADHFTALGQAIVALLIQIGGCLLYTSYIKRSFPCSGKMRKKSSVGLTY